MRCEDGGVGWVQLDGAQQWTSIRFYSIPVALVVTATELRLHPTHLSLDKTKPQSQTVNIEQHIGQCSVQPRDTAKLSTCLETTYQARQEVREVGARVAG
jgi:hypothetical protein